MAAPGALLVMGVSGSGNPGRLPSASRLDPEDTGYHNLQRLAVRFQRSTVGALLASKLGWKFYDADDYHPEENRRKMERGIPLNDQDRIPWLCMLHDVLLRDIASGQHVVLACSALKKMYRDILIRGKDGAAPTGEEPGKEDKPTAVQLLAVYLSGSFAAISGRLLQRKGHFMPPELLQSQFDTLEPPCAPENFMEVSVDRSLSEITATILDTLKMN